MLNYPVVVGFSFDRKSYCLYGSVFLFKDMDIFSGVSSEKAAAGHLPGQETPLCSLP